MRCVRRGCCRARAGPRRARFRSSFYDRRRCRRGCRAVRGAARFDLPTAVQRTCLCQRILADGRRMAARGSVRLHEWFVEPRGCTTIAYSEAVVRGTRAHLAGVESRVAAWRWVAFPYRRTPWPATWSDLSRELALARGAQMRVFWDHPVISLPKKSDRWFPTEILPHEPMLRAWLAQGFGSRLSADVLLRATHSPSSWSAPDCAWSPQNRRARSSCRAPR